LVILIDCQGCLQDLANGDGFPLVVDKWRRAK
jgi:hypothetical protein